MDGINDLLHCKGFSFCFLFVKDKCSMSENMGQIILWIHVHVVVLSSFYILILIKTASFFFSQSHAILFVKQFDFFLPLSPRSLPIAIYSIKFPLSSSSQSFSLFVYISATIYNWSCTIVFLWRIMKNGSCVVCWCGESKLWCFSSFFVWR